jgi:hypothetical protein
MLWVRDLFEIKVVLLTVGALAVDTVGKSKTCPSGCGQVEDLSKRAVGRARATQSPMRCP